jgi:hypothetical protein
MRFPTRTRLRRWRDRLSLTLFVLLPALFLTKSCSWVFDPPERTSLVYAAIVPITAPAMDRRRKGADYLELKGDFITVRLPYPRTVSKEAVERLMALKPEDRVRVLRQRSITTTERPIDVWGVEVNGVEIVTYEAVASERVRVQGGVGSFMMWTSAIAVVARLLVSRKGLRLLLSAA